MPNNRVKTLKSLQSKKLNSTLSKLHPHSRRAKQLNRVALRTEKLASCKKDRNKADLSKVNRLLYFCHALDPSLEFISLSNLHELVEDFINRNSQSIEFEKSNRRLGRSKSVLQQKLEFEVERDRIEYQNGFVLPDLTSPQSVTLLRQWSHQHSGDPSFLPRLRLISISATDKTSIVIEQLGAADTVAFNLPACLEEGPSGQKSDPMDQVEQT